MGKYKIENDLITYFNSDGDVVLVEGYFGTIRYGSAKAINKKDLSEYKKYLIETIDAKTSGNILQGFTFGGEIFSMSYNAQINWSNILQLPEQIFPICLSTKNNNVYMLSLENRMNFYLTSVNHKNIELQNGTTLNQSVISATTIAELEIIENSL